MVFRRDTKVDAFQRQISALRQQLGTSDEADQPLDDRSYDASAVDEPTESADSTERAYSPTSAASTPRQRDTYSFDMPDAASRENAVVATAPEMPALPIPIGDGTTSVVADDTVWNGDLQSNGSIHIHGRAMGTISTKQDVFVADGAEVEALINANSVLVAGVVRGTIRCITRFEALPQGRIASDIFAPTVVVHEGAIITGQFRMDAVTDEAPVAKPAPALVQRRAARGG